MFNKEYVGVILTPFVGKTIRMRTGNTIPFCLETSIESTFQIQLVNSGIKFVLIDNYYIKRDLGKVFNEAFQTIEIYPFQMDSLLKEKDTKGIDAIVYGKLLEYMQTNLAPQIAYTYYTMIKSLRVEEKRFFLNDVEFFVTT